MRIYILAAGLLLLATVDLRAGSRLATDAEIDAAQKAPLPQMAIEGEWNEPHEPFRVIGNIYYVGTKTVSS